MTTGASWRVGGGESGTYFPNTDVAAKVIISVTYIAALLRENAYFQLMT